MLSKTFLKNGTKLWRFDFSFEQKRQTMSFGIYPDISLKIARDMREKATDNIKHGINPIDSKQSDFKIENTFKFVANKWLETMKDGWSESNYKKIQSNLDHNAIAILGNRDIKSITRKDILSLVERMEKRGAIEYANRLLNNIERIYKYAITHEFCEHNIVAEIDKKNSLKRIKKVHYPAITKIDELKQLLIDIENYGTNFMADISTIYALKLAPYLPFRPYNLRFLEWTEINFTDKYIDISAEKMKMDNDFIMPLSEKALEILKEVEQFKTSKYVFPSTSNNTKPISENTLNHALHRMGYKDRHVMHGFRSTFSTLAHDNITKHCKHSDIIEACLAHQELNVVKASYNRVDKYKYIDEKRELIFWWNSFLFSLY